VTVTPALYGTPSIIIEKKFNGPPRSGNGGYAAGAFARAFGLDWSKSAAVTLLAPVPLGIPLTLSRRHRRHVVRHTSTLIATVSALTGDPTAPVFVPVDVAQDAASNFSGRCGHPFSRCFVCGTERQPADGLGLTPGRLARAADTVACTWSPERDLASQEGLISAELVWSVLDCPGGWACGLDLEDMLLSRISACLLEPVYAGEHYVVVGQLERRHGRTAVASTALYREDGLLLAKANALWVKVEASYHEHGS
jgi:acyl-coenzyme A thioesterase PaaI-like protein